MARNAVDRLEGHSTRHYRPDSVGTSDTLPEHTIYKDTGCGHGCVRSLECPFPRCRYDDPEYWQRLERQGRDSKVLAARAYGLTVDALAQRFGISRRTVHRILARAREAHAPNTALSVPKKAA